jgi:hypothetical protein
VRGFNRDIMKRARLLALLLGMIALPACERVAEVTKPNKEAASGHGLSPELRDSEMAR